MLFHKKIQITIRSKLLNINCSAIVIVNNYKYKKKMLIETQLLSFCMIKLVKSLCLSVSPIGALSTISSCSLGASSFAFVGWLEKKSYSFVFLSSTYNLE